MKNGGNNYFHQIFHTIFIGLGLKVSEILRKLPLIHILASRASLKHLNEPLGLCASGLSYFKALSHKSDIHEIH